MKIPIVASILVGLLCWFCRENLGFKNPSNIDPMLPKVASQATKPNASPVTLQNPAEIKIPPLVTMQWFDEAPYNQEWEDALREFCALEYKRNPVELLSWLSTKPFNNNMVSVLINICDQIDASSSVYNDLRTNIPAGNLRNFLDGEMLSKIVKVSGVERVEQTIKSWSLAPTADQIGRVVAGLDNPSEVASFITKYPNTHYETSVIFSCAIKHFNELPKLVSYFDALPIPNVPFLYRSMTEHFGKIDPLGVSDYLSKSMPSINRDYAIDGFIQANYAKLPLESLIWADAVQDEGIRETLVKSTFPVAYRYDRENAVRSIATANISNAIKINLLREAGVK